MLDIISIGDTTTDMFLNIHEASVHCDLHQENCQICFSYADKVPVESIENVPAVGNAANNAVGSSRLGMKAGLYTVLGGDIDGKACLTRLKEEKVATKYIQIDKKHRTNYSTVLNFQGERTILVYHEHRNYKLPKLELAAWVYLTSMYEHGADKFHREIISYLKKSGAKLAFNPGTYQMKLGLTKLRNFFAVTDVLFVNKEEAERILVKKADVSTLLRDLVATGVKIAVITDGMQGSYAFDGKTMYYSAMYPGKAFERTGAGDSYGTAFVAALHNGASMPDAMKWGSINAASVVKYVGAQRGLLDKKTILKTIKQHPEFRPRVM